MITATQLTRRFGAKTALDGISLTASEGELVAIVGANGAGKSSLIRTIAGIEKPRTGRIRWSFGPGVIERQHAPRVLDDGHVLLLDNGTRRGWSRVLEVDPVDGGIVRSWGEAAGERFFTATEGSVEELPGGNLLLTISSEGRVVEVAPDGAIVWEYLGPNKGPGERAKIYRAHGVPQGVGDAILRTRER